MAGAAPSDSYLEYKRVTGGLVQKASFNFIEKKKKKKKRKEKKGSPPLQLKL